MRRTRIQSKKDKKVKSKKILKRDKQIIEKALRKYLEKLKGPAILRRAMQYAVFSGGKKLRPILTLESASALKGDIREALPFACAIEFVHNFSLVHDDLPSMDNDDFRRGKPACHKKFGEGLAVLAGDALLNLAFGILAALKSKNAREAAFFMSNTVGVRNMLGGQALDLGYERGEKRSKKLKNKIDRMKTAALMALSCKIGALAAGARPQHTKRMHEFGVNLGLAFQIADDIKDSRQGAARLGRMKKEAKELILKGKKYLDPFGEKAGTLRYIADSILEKET